MNSIWTILGLEGPTSDLKAIKRAYAKKLRVTRPDDDPEGFMALRDALEQAQFSAQYVDFEEYEEFGPEDNFQPGAEDSAVSSDSPVLEGQFETQETSEIGQALRKNLADKLTAQENENEANDAEYHDISEAIEIILSDSDKLIEDVKTLLSETFGRNETARWKAIFDDSRLDAIDTAIDFEEYFRSYLLEELGYFSGDPSLANKNRKRPLFGPRVGTFIFNQMGWRDVNGRAQYIQHQLDWLRIDMDVINQNRPQAQVNADIEFVDQYFDENEATEGFPMWGIGAILFGLYIAAKFLTNAYGNGMY